MAIFFLFLCLFSTCFASSEVDREHEDRLIVQRGLRNAAIYQRVTGQGLVEITGQVAKKTVSIRDKIESQQRRIFLFEYPSDGLMVKGYISFVSSCKEQPLLVFLRGGSNIFGLKHPANPFSFFGNYTVIATSYRGEVSEGIDGYGGADVNDIKHLIDFIPTLEKKLGICISKREKYLLGRSRGGMQMFLALARFPELQQYFDKVISLSGILDMEQYVEDRTDMSRFFSKRFGADAKWLAERNPLTKASSLRKNLPILIVQGSADSRISLKIGYSMLAALKGECCTVDYLEVEGGAHCLNNVPDRLDLLMHWLQN